MAAQKKKPVYWMLPPTAAIATYFFAQPNGDEHRALYLAIGALFATWCLVVAVVSLDRADSAGVM